MDRARVLTSANPISDELLHVQVEVIEAYTCFILQLDLKVCNFRLDLMKTGSDSDTVSCVNQG